jgi:Ca2+-binding RTX toxin-like protein
MAIVSGSQFLVNSIDDGNQTNPSICSLADGGFLIAWQDDSGSVVSPDDGDGVRFARYDAFGNRVGFTDTLINTETLSAQFDPSVAGFANGGFVAVWTDSSQQGPDTNNRAIRAQVFSADGKPSGDEFTVNSTYALSQTEPSVSVLANGNFVVTWTSEMVSASGTTDIIGRVFNTSGNPVTNEFTVNSQTLGNQNDSEVHSLKTGGFAVVWNDREASITTGNQVKTFIRFFDNSGAPTSTSKVVSELGDPKDVAFAELTDGRVVVTYSNYDGFATGDGSGGSIYAKVYNPLLGTFSSPISVNTVWSNDQTAPQIAALDNGQFVVVWTDNSKDSVDTSFQAIRMQVFNASGGKVGNEIVVNTTTTFEQQKPVITVLQDYRFVVAWEDNSHDGGDAFGFSIRSKVFDARSSGIDLDGSDLADKYLGSSFGDSISGLGGSDKIYGGGGIDVILGGLGSDLLRGDGGNDKVKGDGGNDTVQGGTGNDLLSGGGGNDKIFGHQGNDTLNGGTGADTFVFNTILNAKSNVDKLADFKVIEDTIQLEDAVFAGIVNQGGHLAASQFTIGAAAADANDRIIYKSSTGQLFYDADGTGAGAAKLFATIATGLALSEFDFVVI